MKISQIWGLAGLIGVFYIVFLYLLRPKKETLIIPSTYLWTQISEELASKMKIEKLRKSILFFLDILIALLICIFLLGLYIQQTQNSAEKIIVIDAGFSMNSTDITPSRLEKAKLLAKDYVTKLKDDTKISLVVLQKNTNIIYKNEENKNLVINTIENIKPCLSQTKLNDIKKIPKNLNISSKDMVYFGDKYLKNIECKLTKTSDDNLSINNLATKKTDKGIFTAVTIKNEDHKAKNVEVSLYTDDLYLETKEINLAKKTAKHIIFEGIGQDTKIIKAVIENKDINQLDNTRYTINETHQKLKTAIVSDNSFFEEKFLSIRKDIELFKTKPQEYVGLDDFDLYVFVNFIPENLPKNNSSILYINPKEHANKIGYIENPAFKIAKHPITNYLNDDFNIGVSSVYEKNSQFEPIITLENDLLAFSTVENNRKIVVLGFEFNYTDLPVSPNFPIIMNNIISFLANSRVTDKPEYDVLDIVKLNLKAETTKAYIKTPTGKDITLDTKQDNISFNSTAELGVYEINEKVGETDKKSYFVVNTQLDSDELLDDISYTNKNATLTKLSIDKWIAILILILLTIEILIRHKHNLLKKKNKI